MIYSFILAFFAGFISFLSPCVLPLIPGYISYISGQSLDQLIDRKELVVLNKIDLVDEDTVKDIIDHFSKGKNCEIITMTTLKKDSISKITAKLMSYVS